MRGVRAVITVVAIAVFSLPLASCSGSDEQVFQEAFWEALQALHGEFGQHYDPEDPFNEELWNSDRFFDNWPGGVPVPFGQASDTNLASGRHNTGGDSWESYGNWAGREHGAGDEYGERLEDAGWKQQGDQTTETDEVTGWEETTSTYQDENGRTVEVRSTDRGETESVYVAVSY